MVLWDHLQSASLKLSQSTVHQRQMHQLSVFVVQQHRELWVTGLNTCEGHMRGKNTDRKSEPCCDKCLQVEGHHIYLTRVQGVIRMCYCIMFIDLQIANACQNSNNFWACSRQHNRALFLTTTDAVMLVCNRSTISITALTLHSGL